MRALVIGKFMPFHKGHQLLIDVATNYVWEISKLGLATGFPGVDVVVGSLPTDPIPGHLRYQAVANYVDTTGIASAIYHIDYDMPQHPDDVEFWNRHPILVPDFWALWKSRISNLTRESTYDYVFSSEPYGETLAKMFNAVHIPVDVDRAIVPISGTACRKDLINNWNNLNVEYRKLTQINVSVIGAESTGKTTLVNSMIGYDTTIVPEFARGYLQIKGAENTSPTDFKHLIYGQIAVFQSIAAQADTPVVLRDTDIMTTIGWFRILNPGLPIPDFWYQAAQDYAADLYVILDTNIEFEQDAQRYGGDVRQTTTQFWIDLAEELGLKWVLIQSPDLYERQQRLIKAVEPLLQ
jgi:NadR type nicotinamide-nucleotide adenylyltransferase